MLPILACEIFITRWFCVSDAEATVCCLTNLFAVISSLAFSCIFSGTSMQQRGICNKQLLGFICRCDRMDMISLGKTPIIGVTVQLVRNVETKPCIDNDYDDDELRLIF